MDYDFEAPTYVNFAEAMDEDDAEISRYFDVEHEESFSRIKSTPGVILPGGPRALSAKKPATEPISSSSKEVSSNPMSHSEEVAVSCEPERQSKTPAKRRSSGRPRTSTVKTPRSLRTPKSVKRLARGKPVTTTPGKVAAALTALKLTPAHKVAVTPASAKRSRNNIAEDPQSAAKRVKLTPKVAVSEAATMKVSPPSLDVDGLLQQALRPLSSRKVRRGLAGQLVSMIDGIEVPCHLDKEHTMETRADKAARDPPIRLRSRSIAKVSSDRADETKPSVPRRRSLSNNQAAQPANQDKNTRARSIDRLLKPSQALKAKEPFVSLAEATNRFQNRTPLRFRMKRQISPAVKVKGPVLALRATIPQSPALRVKHRNRPISVMSREEQEAQELEEIKKNKIKPLPLPDKILRAVVPIPKVERKPPTLPEPFNITELKKKESYPTPEPVKFTARPVPKKILEGPVGIAEKKDFVLTDPKSPSFCANALKRMKEAKRITPLKHMNKVTMKVLEETGGVKVVKDKPLGHLGVPSTAQVIKSTTQVKPFSFEERDKYRIQRKEEKLKELQKQLSEKKNTFHANPIPSFKTPPQKLRMASPAAAARARTPRPAGLKAETGVSKRSSGNIPETKPALMPHFKARAPTVLHRKPFEPVKPNRQLPLPDVTLASEVRAKDRELYDRQLMLREQELEAARQQLKAEKEMKEKEEIALLRKQVVHKPNPVPKVKPFETQPSDKPLTDPNTPFCLKRSRKLSAV